MLVVILTTYALVARIYAEECEDIYGGHWTLVRHSYAKWFQSTDSLQGTDEYGVYDADPQSIQSWSIPFADELEDDGTTKFMFSNGDCSEWMVTTNDQFLTVFPSAISATILASHVSTTSYQVDWLVRGDSNPEDPWISYGNHADNTFATNMYAENAVATGCGHTDRCQRWDNYPSADKSLNVWIQTKGDRDCTQFAIDDWLLECSQEWADHGDTSDLLDTRITALESAVTAAETSISSNTANIATNTGDITSLKTDVGTAQSDIATNAGGIEDNVADIGTNTGNIATAQADIIALDARIDALGVYGAQANGLNVDGFDPTGSSLPFGLMYKDLIIIGLVCVNVVMMVTFACCLCGKPYAQVMAHEYDAEPMKL
eukprot:281814_1